MLLYIHVPFCRRKCNYCAFASTELTQSGLLLYGERLFSEIAHWGDALGRAPVETVYLGGGTPSLLPVNYVNALFARLNQAFEIAPNAEITLEANPESGGSLAYLKELRSVGVNRLSFGVQSFHDEQLQALGRLHTAQQAKSAFYNARSAGFGNVSLDLIWGLPGQRLRLWLDDLKTAALLGPEHLSCYGLTLEPGTRLERAYSRREFELPDEEEQSRMFLYGAERLESEGYLQYEVSNFGRIGFASLHNSGYWEGSDFLGLGPAAVSTIGGRRWTNPAAVKTWAKAVAAGTLGRKVEPLSLETRIKEMVMLRLRTTRGMRLKAYTLLTGQSFLKEHARLIQALRQNELIRIQQGYLRLTKTGMLVADAIIENLFRDPPPALERPASPPALEG
jgi:oxygen-independent coproporphyrinogen-3 oxidase